MLAARKARKASATTSAKRAAAATAAMPGAVPSAAAAAAGSRGASGAAGRIAPAATGGGRGAGGALQGARASRGWGTKILLASGAGLAILGIAWQLKPDEVRKLLDDSPIDHFAIWLMSKYSLVSAEVFLWLWNGFLCVAGCACSFFVLHILSCHLFLYLSHVFVFQHSLLGTRKGLNCFVPVGMTRYHCRCCNPQHSLCYDINRRRFRSFFFFPE